LSSNCDKSMTRKILEFISVQFITDKQEILEYFQIRPPWHFQLDSQLIMLNELGLIEFPKGCFGSFKATKKLKELL
jgi:hypothetical protein